MLIEKNANGKKILKITLKEIILFVCILIVVITGYLIIMHKMIKVSDSNNNFYKEEYNGETYYILAGEYKGEYDLQAKGFSRENIADDFSIQKVMSYWEYKSYCRKWGLPQTYNAIFKKYIVISDAMNNAAYYDVIFSGIKYENSTANVYITYHPEGVVGGAAGFALIIPSVTNANEVSIVQTITRSGFNAKTNKYPETGDKYTLEDNRVIAENSYIKTDNEKVNNIFNNMIDAITKMHTIKITSNTIEDYWDFTTAVRKIRYVGETLYRYTAYNDYGATTYIERSNEDSFVKDRISNTRKDFIHDILNNHYIYFLSNYEEYTIDVIEEEENYVVIAKTPKGFRGENISEIYYINKENYLLKSIKIDAEHTYRIFNTEFDFSYTKDVIEVPKEILKKSTEKSMIDLMIEEMAAKPVIYIYPETKTEVDVKLGNPEKLTTVYPEYKDGWKVIANPDGTLENIETGREYYCLYWEGKNDIPFEYKEGFVVKGEDTVKFLEEKLEILGLNEKEAQEFIIYWLPQMEDNNYNYIRFQTKDEIEQDMPLEIIPEPETTIRVMMEWKALDEEIEVKEQQLEKVERKGYTVVEWGGSERK